MLMNEFKTVTCLSCGWVHMQVSLDYVEQEVARFNEYFDSLPKEKQDSYYGGKKSNVKHYIECLSCGGTYKNFRNSEPNDCPDGCTLNPILNRNEEI